MDLSDVSYDILAVLQSKLDAVAVYDQYIEDCTQSGDNECRQIFEQIKQQDQRHADMLVHEVERLVREGKFH